MPLTVTRERRDGQTSDRSHGPRFLEEVARCVGAYLDTKPDPSRYRFLQYNFDGLQRRYGVSPQPNLPSATIVPVGQPSQPTRYTDRDLQLRVFTRTGARRVQGSKPQPSV